jgi:ABC-2 type transport system ATP-binding protein
VDALCDRIAIIKDGEIVAHVNADEIRHNERKNYQITFATLPDYLRFTQVETPGVVLGETDTLRHRAEVSVNDQEINSLVSALSTLNVAQFKEEKFTLEKYFLHFYEKTDASAATGQPQTPDNAAEKGSQ